MLKNLLKVLLFSAFYIFWIWGSGSAFFTTFTDRKTKSFPLLAVLLFVVAIVLPPGLVPLFFGEPRWWKKVLAEGKPATATIINSQSAGYLRNGRSYVTLKLHVETPDDTPFDFITDERDGYYESTVGTKLAVKYDPQNKKHVLLLSPVKYQKFTEQGREKQIQAEEARWQAEDAAQQEKWQADNAAFAAKLEAIRARRAQQAQDNAARMNDGISAELEKLAEMHKNGDLNDAEFESAKKKLLG